MDAFLNCAMKPRGVCSTMSVTWVLALLLRRSIAALDHRCG